MRILCFVWLLIYLTGGYEKCDWQNSVVHLLLELDVDISGSSALHVHLFKACSTNCESMSSWAKMWRPNKVAGGKDLIFTVQLRK